MWHVETCICNQKDFSKQKKFLESALGLSFSCGSPLQEAYLELPEELLSVVFVRDLQCSYRVEALYYSADYTDICVHCSNDIETTETPPEYFVQISNKSQVQEIDCYCVCCISLRCNLL